jgi:hypothetical protein
MKYLQITMPNQSRWIVPMMIVIFHRAQFRLTQEGYRPEDVGIYIKESLGLEPKKLIDWAADEMDWEDLQPYARQLFSPRMNYHQAWLDSELSVIDDTGFLDDILPPAMIPIPVVKTPQIPDEHFRTDSGEATVLTRVDEAAEND